MWTDDPNVHLGVKSVLHATRVHYTRRSINYSRESSKSITSSLISSSLNYQINYCPAYIGYLLKLIFIFCQIPSIIWNQSSYSYIFCLLLQNVNNKISSDIFHKCYFFIFLYCTFLMMQFCYSNISLVFYIKLFFLIVLILIIKEHKSFYIIFLYKRNKGSIFITCFPYSFNMRIFKAV